LRWFAVLMRQLLRHLCRANNISSPLQAQNCSRATAHFPRVNT
jgi:hypothetical protein